MKQLDISNYLQNLSQPELRSLRARISGMLHKGTPNSKSAENGRKGGRHKGRVRGVEQGAGRVNQEVSYDYKYTSQQC